MYSILVINPNSSVKVTSDMKSLLPEIPQFSYDFYTAPESAPKEIDGEQTSILSESVVFPDLLTKDLFHYDAYLVCCYSDHPLIYSISRHVDKPCMGIMQGTLLYSLSNLRFRKLMILTSFKSWEPLLDKAIIDFFGTGQFPESKMAKTQSLNINVLNLNKPDNFNQITDIVDNILSDQQSQGHKIDCILLGCAGMAGLDTKLANVFPQVKFVDSVRVSTELLSSIVRFENTI